MFSSSPTHVLLLTLSQEEKPARRGERKKAHMQQSVDEVNLSFLRLPASSMPFTIPDAPGLVTSTIKTQNQMSMRMRPKSDTIMRPSEDEASSLLIFVALSDYQPCSRWMGLTIWMVLSWTNMARNLLFGECNCT
jgi:hypothetical protein